MAASDQTGARAALWGDGAAGRGVGRGHVAEIQRARMLGAALEAIDSHGYAGFTVAHVIQRAKVSRKTFYEVFVDREDCFATLFEQAIAQVGRRVSEAYHRQRTWREGVRAGMAELLTFVDEQPALARLCVVEALAAGPRILERRLNVLDQVRAAVELGRLQREGGREPPEVTAEAAIGAVFAVIHTRLLERSSKPYVELLGQLMSILVLPYLGATAAARELTRPLPRPRRTARQRERPAGGDPLDGIDMRLTYRTLRVLQAIGERPDASNREVADAAGISDQGQISKLLARLQRLQLIENGAPGWPRGAPNRWRLTARGEQVELSTRGP
jgi:AcrR family transcriptional regulator